MTLQLPCLKSAFDPASGEAGALPQQIRAQLAGQGYGSIAFEQDGQDLLVTARTGCLVLAAVYDLSTGALMAQDIWHQNDEAALEVLSVAGEGAQAGSAA
ncbi:hypothetical protein [Leisingera sp. JC1]|uniref:hypothetical protein n=1 Tax=Leisingera sp. JC1 TaxID=1855282 RepID=UPI001131A545|nr:hypothetical protein [Leisingera sp. JC1]